MLSFSDDDSRRQSILALVYYFHSVQQVRARCVWEYITAPSADHLLSSAAWLDRSKVGLHRQTWLLVGSHAAAPPFGTVFLHLYALLIVSLVLGLSSRLTCLQDICSWFHSPPLIPLQGLWRVIDLNSLPVLVTYQKPLHFIINVCTYIVNARLR